MIYTMPQTALLRDRGAADFGQALLGRYWL
jgi:hypothetical protein